MSINVGYLISLNFLPEENIIFIVVSLDGDEAPELMGGDGIEQRLTEGDDVFGGGNPTTLQHLLPKKIAR